MTNSLKSNENDSYNFYKAEFTKKITNACARVPNY